MLADDLESAASFDDLGRSHGQYSVLDDGPVRVSPSLSQDKTKGSVLRSGWGRAETGTAGRIEGDLGLQTALPALVLDEIGTDLRQTTRSGSKYDTGARILGSLDAGGVSSWHEQGDPRVEVVHTVDAAAAAEPRYSRHRHVVVASFDAGQDIAEPVKVYELYFNSEATGNGSDEIDIKPLQLVAIQH